MRVRSGSVAALVFGVLALALGGCGSLGGGLHADTLALGAAPLPAASPEPAVEPVAAVVDAPAAAEPAVAAAEAVVVDAEDVVVAAVTETPGDIAGADAAEGLQVAQRGASPPPDTPIEEYDPWEPFNDAMFKFNYNMDRYVLKPVAKGYNAVVPDQVQRMIDNLFTHVRVVPRFVNSLLQAKWDGAFREFGRLVINSVFGLGVFDIAKQEFGIEASNEDFGQTLGVWGVGPGPYVVVPLLSPTTVRDGIGLAVDGAMDPISYVLPFIWERLFLKIVDTVNDRALNLELFEGVEATTVDLYTAVRNAYLQRRAKQIRE